jgi:hypothetical protein
MSPRIPRQSPQAKGRATLATVLPWLATGLLFYLTIATFYPGYLSLDSAYQYWQARKGTFSNQSPPTMTMAWSAVNAVWPGSGGLFVLHAALYWFGIGLTAQLCFRGTAVRAAAVLVTGLLSPALPIVAHLWSDAALIAVLSTASALLLLALMRRVRLALWLALPLLIYAGQVRHNAMPALVPLLLLWAYCHTTIDRTGTALLGRRIIVMALGLFALTIGTEWLLDRFIVKERVSVATIVMLFDLAGISLETGEVLVPLYAPYEGQITLAELADKYSPLNSVPLYQNPNALRDFGYTGEERTDIRRRWIAAITAHPAAYLQHRAAVATKLFGRYGNDRPAALAYVPTVVAYADNPPIRANQGRLNAWVMGTYQAAAATWISAPVTYALVALAALFAAWPRRHSALGRYSLALGASGFAYIAPLTFIAASAELRYSGWLFLSSLFGAAASIAAAPHRPPAFVQGG